MVLITPDVHFYYRKTPETLTSKNLKDILFYMDYKNKNRCIIAFKTPMDLQECKDYIINYIEKELHIKVKASLIRADVLKLEKEV